MQKFAFFGLGVFRSVMSVRRGEAEALAADAMKELGGAAAAGKRATEQNEETPNLARFEAAQAVCAVRARRGQTRDRL